MDRTPTYVIGVGGAGVRVVSELQSRSEGESSDSLGLMAIDADNERLGELSGLPTLHLKSDSGLLENRASGYPFLTSDVYVPDDGADCRRHVGRYKLDNDVSPTFRDHRRTIATHLTGFVDRIDNALEAVPGTYNVVLVSSMADGIGSGAFPLLVPTLRDISMTLGSESRQIHVFYLGILPPLGGIDDISDPCAYVNTHAALRNLDTLLDAQAGRPLILPVYSGQNTSDGDERRENGRRRASVERPLLDACWLVDGELEVGGPDDTPDRRDTIASICDGLYALTTRTPDDCEPLSHGSPTSPLGTFGYARVAVPHERVGRYCELRADRDEIVQKLEEYVRPKVESLRHRKAELKLTLDTPLQETPLLDDWVERAFSWLDSPPEPRREFVSETAAEQLEAVLNQFSTVDAESYLRASESLRYELSERGEAGSAVCTEARQTIATVRETHDHEPPGYSRTTVPATQGEDRGREALEQMISELEGELEQRKETYRERRSETEPGLRDLLPATYDVFTSSRERLSREIARIDESLDSLAAARETLETLEEFRTLARNHEQAARERLRQELDGVENDLDHYRAELRRLREERQALDETLSAERLALAQPDNSDPVRYLPLRYEELQSITRDEHAEELTSIGAYRERGLIDGGEEAIHELLRECYRESRDWSPSVSRHRLSVSRRTVHESTFVLYQEANQSLVVDLASEFTEPDTIWLSSDRSTQFIDDPFHIEVVSLSHGGSPRSLKGFRKLAEWEKRHYLQDLATTRYESHGRAIAYPEWYDGIEDEFE